MAGLTRRQILKAGAGAGVGALALDPVLRSALALKPPPGELNDIQHVVILIQENRSFDHYFGLLPGVRGYGDKSVPKSTFEQPGYPVEGYDGVLLPFHSTGMNSAGLLCYPDITHSWVPQHEAWNGGAMDRFLEVHLANEGAEAGPATMSYFERADIPFYYALAENYTVCDNYYCSVIGPTYPNRLYSMSATLDPDGTGGGPLVETLVENDTLHGRFTWTTMPEQLSAADVSWKVYTGPEVGIADNVLGFFKNFQTNPQLKSLGLEPTYPKGFVQDIRHKELPQVSWIDPNLTLDEHPGNSAPKLGESLVAELVQLLHRHGYWKNTALFVTYDENGGFFDHVSPPVAPPGTPGEYLTVEDLSHNSGGIKGPIGLGFRVPLLVVSPYSRGGFLCSDVFDHTSLLRFLETRFGVEVPNLTAWRRENTGDLTSAFNFKQPNMSKGKLPKVKVSGEEESVCLKPTPLPVPPNSFPQQQSRVWKTPSGP
jgi:phospholipase C